MEKPSSTLHHSGSVPVAGDSAVDEGTGKTRTITAWCREGSSGEPIKRSEGQQVLGGNVAEVFDRFHLLILPRSFPYAVGIGGQKNKMGCVTRHDGAKMAVVERQKPKDVETFRRRHHRGVGQTDFEVVVLIE